MGQMDNQEDIDELFYWKFRAINQDTLCTLINKEIWFSKPEYFNDPFDAQICIDTLFEGHRMTNALSLIKKHMKEYYSGNPFAYYCLCGTYKETLMWSHYASNHTGVAFGFSKDIDCLNVDKTIESDDISYDPAAFEKAISSYEDKWKYRKGVNEDNHWGIMNDEKYSELFNLYRRTKAECWHYEKEVRLSTITNFKNGMALSISPEFIKHIIFGLNCKMRDVNTIKNIVKNSEFSHVSLWKAVRNHATLKIDIVSSE